MSFELFYMPSIGHGLDWIGFRKLDPRPTLVDAVSQSLYIAVL